MAKKKKFIRKFHLNWKSFFSGLAIGLAIAFLLFYFLANRYEIKSSGPSGIYTIKSDKWTGKSWILRYYKDNKQNFITEFYWEIISIDKWQRYIIEEPENAKQKEEVPKGLIPADEEPENPSSKP